MARIPERLPLALSERLGAGAAARYTPFGRECDVAVGGIPFRLATNPELPHSTETVEIRKDQFDTEVDPGEQSLSGWWRRSQSSWHEGAGLLYQESSDNNQASNGFFDSSGVEVFDKGKLYLLRAMKANGTTTGFSRLRTYAAGASMSAVKDGALWNATAPSGAFASLHAPASKTIVDGVISQTTFHDVASDGTLYQGDVSSPGTATTWPCGATPSRLGWGKHRLWMIGGQKIWQPDVTLADGTTQNPVFTHPNPGWTYTCMAEGPGAMFFGGHDGLTSSIQAVTMDSDMAIPSLSGAVVGAVLPEGELVNEIVVLAGQFIGIGTNKGFRVGLVQQDNSINYGPLLIEPSGVSSCSALTTFGKFFIVAFTTATAASVTYKVDTSVDLGDGVMPYAKFVDCGTAQTITSLAIAGNDVLALTSDGLPWYQHATEKVASGYFQSGRIRYRTTEPKSYKFLNIEAEPLAGSIQCDLILEGGSTMALGSFTAAGELPSDPMTIQSAPLRYASVKLTLTRSSSDVSQGPVLTSYLLRALPATPPQRLYTLPLLCFDKETSRSGQVYQGVGFARSRIKDLHALENLAESVIFQDFSEAGEGHLVTIESVRYVQTSPPRTDRSDAAGGILILKLRSADA